MIPAPLWVVIPPQEVDPPLDPRQEPVPPPESPTPLLGPPPRRRNVLELDLGLLRQPLVGRRRQPAIHSQLVRRPAELLLVLCEAVARVRLVLSAALFQDSVPG